MAKWIKADGSMEDVEPNNGSDFSLEELNKFVDGFIEVVWLPNGKLMVVNEEGQLKRLIPNPVASIIARQMIVGNVLLCDEGQVK